MRVIPDPTLPDVLLLEPETYRDERGLFLEMYHEDRYAEAGVGVPFVQVNRSRSREGVLRGMHFQHPRPQGKLVSVASGEILDVAVDIRLGSPTFGRWCAYRLSAEEGRQLWVPPDFAHGFVVLSGSADVIYTCTERYDRTCEHSLLWSDPQIAIRWPVDRPVLSTKDRRAPTLEALAADGRLPSMVGVMATVDPT